MPFSSIGGSPPKEDTLSPGLLRQRRNLVVLSIFLILFDVATVKPEKLSLFGAELGLPRTGTYVLFAWISLIYFVWRYYQYLNEEPGLTAKTAAFLGRIRTCADQWAARNGWASEPHAGNNHMEGFALRWAYLANDGGMGRPTRVEGAQLIHVIPTLLFAWWVLKATTHFTVRSTYATDYLLPIALAITAPALYIWQRV